MEKRLIIPAISLQRQWYNIRIYDKHNRQVIKSHSDYFKFVSVHVYNNKSKYFIGALAVLFMCFGYSDIAI
jgi:hypothetical protein